MQDITGTQVVSVESSPTKNGSLRYIVALNDGAKPPSTFDIAKATKAQQAIGQTVDVRVSHSADGKFRNFEDIAPVGQLPPLALPPGTPIPVAQATPIPQAQPQQANGSWKRDPETEKRIVRQSSLATAFKFIGHVYSGAGPEALTEATEHAHKLAGEILERVFADAPEPAQSVQTAPEVAAQVNEVLGTSAVAVGTTQGPSW